MNLAERVRQVMERKGDNARQMAARAGLGYATIHGILSGERKNPQRETVEAIARAYRVSVGWLLTGEGEAREETPEDAVAQGETDRELATLVETVRKVNGSEAIPADERQRLMLDIIHGAMTLRQRDGLDVGPLVELRGRVVRGEAI